MYLSTTNWHLPRALPTREQQRHLPSASTEIEPHAARAVDLYSTSPEGVQSGVRHSVLQGISWDRSLDSWMFLGTDFMISVGASPVAQRLKCLPGMREPECGRSGFYPWVWKIPWRRKRQPTPVLLPGGY